MNSLDLGFEGETDYGVYHSAYDSFDHFRRFVDPTFEYGVALAKVAGRLMLRAAQAQLLPARESDFAASIALFDDELHKLADGMRVKSREQSKLLEDDSYKLATDPGKPRAPPAPAAEVPYLNFAELDNAVAKLERSARTFDREYVRVAAGDEPTATAGPGTDQCGADGPRASPDGSTRPSRPRVVSAHDLRAGSVYRLWRENPAGDSRGNRRAPLGRG